MQTIIAYPLQVYASALVFSPTRSIVRKLYKQDEPNWITMKPQVNENWDACLQSLEVQEPLTFSSAWFVVWSRDGKRLAVGMDRSVKVWDALTGTCLQVFHDNEKNIEMVAFSPVNSLLLASGGRDGIVNTLDLAAGTCLPTFQVENYKGWIHDVSFSADGQYLAAGCDRSVTIWDVETKSHVRTLGGFEHDVLSIAFSPNTQVLASASSDIKLWDVSTGVCLKRFKQHEGTAKTVAFSTHGKWLASGSTRGQIKVWDVQTGACLHMLDGSVGCWIRSVSFSADDQRLALAGDGDNMIQMWDTASGDLLQTLMGHQDDLTSVAFSPFDAQQLASTSRDGTVKIWRMDATAHTSSSNDHAGSLTSVVFSGDGKRLVTLSGDEADDELRVWDTSTYTCLRAIKSGFGTFSENSQWLATMNTTRVKSLDIWDAKTATCQQTVEHGSRILSIAFSGNNRQLVSGAINGSVKVWESYNWGTMPSKCVYILDHGRSVSSVAFSPNNQQLASVSKIGIKLWNMADGTCVRRYDDKDEWYPTITWSADSRWLAGECLDSVVIYDAHTNEQAKATLNCQGSLELIAFTADSQWVAISTDLTLSLWNIETGQHVWNQDITMFSKPLTRMSPDSTSQTRLLTNLGLLNLDLLPAFHDPEPVQGAAQSQAQRIYHSGYGISMDGQCVLRGEDKLLFLPAEYRSAAIDVSGSTIAIGCQSGRVILMSFN